MKQLLKYVFVGSAIVYSGLAAPVVGQDNTVTLQSADGLFQVTGEMMESDDTSYVVMTAIGEIRVDRNAVECSGAACPLIEVIPSTEVTLTAGDGSVFSGDLVEFDGTNYILDTQIGQLTIRGEFVTCTGEGCPTDEEMADMVDTLIKLTSGDGTFFEGELLDFDGINYVIATSIGELTIRSEFVSCEGEVCPDLTPDAVSFSIASPAGVGERFIGTALRQFAREKNLNITRSVSGTGERVQYLMGDDKGNLIANIDVIPAGDIQSISSVLNGTATFALTRELFSGGDRLALDAGLTQAKVDEGLDDHTIALDGLSTQTHPSNRVDSISIEAMGDIISGRFVNWAQVGGVDADIHLHVLNPESNLSRIVARDILGPRRLSVSANATVHATLEDLNNAIANDPQGFAMTYRSEGDGTQVITTRNACNMFSTANAFSLQTEEYPLTMRWNLYAPKGHAGMPEMSSTFIEYLLSDAGQEAAKSAGLVGLEIASEPMRNQGERLLSAILSEQLNNRAMITYRAYLAEVSSAERLSTTLRFLTGSSQLDERALRDISRIAALASDHETMDGNQLIIVGFSDSIGNFGGNINLSRSRAAQVKQLILQETLGFLEDSDITTFGFGPAAPVGCNSSVEGRDLNRRVEVWIRGKNVAALATN